MAAPSRLEILEQQRLSLDRELSDIARARKRAKGTARASAATKAREWLLSDTQQRTVLIIYTLSGCEVDPAARYLAARGRERHWPEKTAEELHGIVEGLFSSCGVDRLAALTDTTAPSDPVSMRAAIDVVQEWQAVAWTQRANYDQGVAPSCGAILERVEHFRSQLPAAVQPAPQGTAAQGRGRMWCTRLRAKWGGRYKKIKVQEPISDEEMRTKAGAPSTPHQAVLYLIACGVYRSHVCGSLSEIVQ